MVDQDCLQNIHVKVWSFTESVWTVFWAHEHAPVAGETGYLCFVFLTPQSHLLLTLNVVVCSLILTVSFCDIMESFGTFYLRLSTDPPCDCVNVYWN